MKLISRLFAILMTMMVVTALVPVAGGYKAYAAGQDSNGIVVVENSEDVHSLLDPLYCDAGEQILPVTIDTEDGTAVVDGYGEEESFSDVFALSGKKRRSVGMESDELDRDTVLDMLLQDPCIVHEQKDGTLRASYPFAMKILFVLLHEGQLSDTFGAANAVYDRETMRYVLQYGSQMDAANAYAQLTEIWGQDSVLIDLPAAPVEDVKYDEENGNQTYSTYTTEKSLSWGVDVMYLDRLRDWADQNPTAGTLKVAIIDTGVRVDENNEKIIDGYGIDARRIIESYCQSIKSSVFDYTAVNNFSDSGWQPKRCSYADLHGHGTHVMSTILDGTPYQVKVFAIRNCSQNAKFYDSSRYANTDIDSMTKSIQKAGERGAKVVNMSQGINCYDYNTKSGTGTYIGYYGVGISEMEDISASTFEYYNDEITRLVKKYDLSIVASAGNDGQNNDDFMHFPSMNKEVAEVTNLKYSGGFTLASTSNYGSNVTFCAPGTTIVGAGYDWDTHSACYVNKSGTSMAAPHVSAALATIRLYYPEMSYSEAADLLKKLCTDLGNTGKDEEYGYGFPQFGKMLKMIFVHNDGETANEEFIMPKGMPLPAIKDPEREGYKFEGWYADKDCTQKFDFSKPVMKASYLYAKWSTVKIANPLSVKGKTAEVRYSKLKKKTQSLDITKVIKFVKKGQGTNSYTLSSAKKGSKSYKKYFKFSSKTGKVTIKKGLKKGTYTLKVKVKAAGNTRYKPSSLKTVTIKIKVK